jgi:hypothetical protein
VRQPIVYRGQNGPVVPVTSDLRDDAINALSFADQLATAQRLLYRVLLDDADERGVCRTCEDYLAGDVGCKRTAIAYHTRTLVEKGFLVVTYGDRLEDGIYRRINTYALTVPKAFVKQLRPPRLQLVKPLAADAR